MPAAHVQSAVGASTSSAAPTRAFGSNVTAGNVICGAVEWDSTTATLTSVTDSLGNTYTLRSNPITNIAWRSAMFYAQNIAAGACTLTFTFSGAVVSGQVFHEVSGVAAAAFDVSNMQSQDAVGTGTDAITSPSVTTTAAGEYIFGCTSEVSSGNGITQGTGFTLPANSSAALNNGGNIRGEYLVQGAAGAIAATFTGGGTGNYTFTGIMTFKATAAGETITMDKWFHQTSLPQRRARGMLPTGTIGIKAP